MFQRSFGIVVLIWILQLAGNSLGDESERLEEFTSSAGPRPAAARSAAVRSPVPGPTDIWWSSGLLPVLAGAGGLVLLAWLLHWVHIVRRVGNSRQTRRRQSRECRQFSIKQLERQDTTFFDICTVDNQLSVVKQSWEYNDWEYSHAAQPVQFIDDSSSDENEIHFRVP